MNSGIFGGLVPQDQPAPNDNNRPSQPNVIQGFAMGNLVQGIIDESKERLNRMYKYPADYKEAKVHEMATRFGYSYNKLKDGETVPVCPCCQNLTSTMEINICYSTSPNKPEVGQPVFLVATDTSLYFYFVKMVVIFLLMKLLVVDAFVLYASTQGQFCHQNFLKTGSSCTYTYSGYNLMSGSNQAILNYIDLAALAFTILSCVFFTIFRKKLAKMQDWLDFNETTEDDFTVLVEDIPSFLYDQEYEKDYSIEELDDLFSYRTVLKDACENKIYQWLETIVHYKDESEAKDKLEKDFFNKVVKKMRDPEDPDDPDQNLLLWDDNLVTSINLCYDLTEIENLSNLRQQLVDEFLLKNKEVVTQKPKGVHFIPNQIKKVNEQYIKLCEKFALDINPSFNLSKFTGKAFVSFQYNHYRDYFIHEAQRNPNFLSISGKPLRVSRTNQPEDIFWYNMKVTDYERTRNIFYSYCILFMLLVVSFGALLGLQFWQLAQAQNHVGTSTAAIIGSYLISGSMAVLTTIINQILAYTVEILADSEKHKTKSDRVGSLILKIVISQFLNTSIIYSILYLIKPANPLSTIGIVNKVGSLIVVSGIFNLVWYAILPTSTIFSIIYHYKYTPNTPINLFQYQLNANFEKPAFSYSYGYSFYIIYTYVVCWYGFLYPLGTIILVLLFIVQYWIDKFNFYKRCSSPYSFGFDLVRLVQISFEFSVFLFALGFFLWETPVHYDISAGFRVVNILNLAIASIWVLLAFFMPARIKDKLFGQEDKTFEYATYITCRKKGIFKSTYFRESPATFCLKEKKIKKKIKKTEQGYDEDDSVSQDMDSEGGEDPIFIEQNQYDKYLNLPDDEKDVMKYSELMVDMFNNPDYEYEMQEEDQNDMLQVFRKIKGNQKKDKSKGDGKSNKASSNRK